MIHVSLKKLKQLKMFSTKIISTVPLMEIPLARQIGMTGGVETKLMLVSIEFACFGHV